MDNPLYEADKWRLPMNSDEVLAVILGGGRGTRLFPLTQMRSKPAVPIAGQYRLIDIPISNCINSNIFKIAVLTQFNSVSLHRHITDTYQFDRFHSGWVQIWAAEQTMDNADWYQGTADAVRKQLSQIVSANAKYVLILAGDHLYRCNYAEMLDFHIKISLEANSGISSLSNRHHNPDFSDGVFSGRNVEPQFRNRQICRHFVLRHPATEC